MIIALYLLYIVFEGDMKLSDYFFLVTLHEIIKFD